MCAALPRSEYYGGSVPSAPSAGVAPIPALPPRSGRQAWNARGWFPRSLSSGQRVRHPALPLRHRPGYCRSQFAVASGRRLWRPCPKFPAPSWGGGCAPPSSPYPPGLSWRSFKRR